MMSFWFQLLLCVVCCPAWAKSGYRAVPRPECESWIQPFGMPPSDPQVLVRIPGLTLTYDHRAFWRGREVPLRGSPSQRGHSPAWRMLITLVDQVDKFVS